MQASRLVASLARTQFSEQEAQLSRSLLQSEVDWDGFMAVTQCHHVVPLVWAGIRTIGCAESVPSSVRRDLEERSRSIALHNMRLAGELRQILQALAEAGIEVMPLRGAALAAWLYGDVNLRMFADIDIMVREGNVLDAARCLQGIGVTPNADYTGRRFDRLIRADCEWHFTSPTGTHVELHWRVFGPELQLRRFERDLWERSCDSRFLGQPVRCMSAEDTAIMLAVHHGGKHRFEELRHICDFSEIVRSDRVRWDCLTDRARETGTFRYVLTSMSVVKNALNVDPPVPMRAAVRADPLAEEAGSALAEPFLTRQAPVRRVPPILFNFRQRERLRDRFSYIPQLSRWLARAIFVPTEKELRYVPLPRPFRAVLVPFRLVRLTLKYAVPRRRGGKRES